jgi:hypothetical protein
MYKSNDASVQLLGAICCLYSAVVLVAREHLAARVQNAVLCSACMQLHSAHTHTAEVLA